LLRLRIPPAAKATGILLKGLETYSTYPTKFNFSLSSETVLGYEFRDGALEKLTSIYTPGWNLSIEGN
jgi:hypothetical protein